MKKHILFVMMILWVSVTSWAGPSVGGGGGGDRPGGAGGCGSQRNSPHPSSIAVTE